MSSAPASLSLLMVEDEPTARSLVHRMISLRFPGCTIYSAENGKDGLRIFQDHNPDIVLTDINMPEMDGIEMARAIRALDEKARFIVLTAYGDRGYHDAFEQTGFCAYLMKPVDFKELFATIERCSADIARKP